METGARVLSKPPEGGEKILSADALEFLVGLARQFEPTRRALLERRRKVQIRFDRGESPVFLEETRSVREGAWKVAATPADLQRRWVEMAVDPQRSSPGRWETGDEGALRDRQG